MSQRTPLSVLGDAAESKTGQADREETSIYMPLADLRNPVGWVLGSKVFCATELADQGVGPPGIATQSLRHLLIQVRSAFCESPFQGCLRAARLGIRPAKAHSSIRLPLERDGREVLLTHISKVSSKCTLARCGLAALPYGVPVSNAYRLPSSPRP